MPTTKRQIYDEAVCHIIQRGNNRQALFKEREDFEKFLSLIRKKYGYTGYLYQGRYKSKIIQKDSYLLECARYIERNPIRAGIVENLTDYEWTSYNFYGYGGSNNLLTANPLYNNLSSDETRRKELYREYVSATRLYEEFIDKEFKIKQGS